jgi:2-dehydropantoate 2-reductase
MRCIKNVLIAGAGAVGASYGSRIFDKEPHNISILAKGERLERYRQKGISINGKLYKFNCISPCETIEPMDLIIIAVKFHQLDEIIENIKAFVGENTIILSLLNGISSEEIIGKAFGVDKVLYSMCVGIDAVREGNGITFSTIGRISFGEAENIEYTERVKAVKELFDRTEIPYTIPESMMKTLWWKFMINVGINQSSAVLRASYGVFQNAKEAKELMFDTMKEVIVLSQKVGVNLTDQALVEWEEVLKTLSPQGKTSMLQDIEAGRKTEVEIFGGTVCDLGRKYKLQTPINDTLVKLIQINEVMYNLTK